ncbi:hypothetical protein D3C77_718730 [compost metagenome]
MTSTTAVIGICREAARKPAAPVNAKLAISVPGKAFPSRINSTEPSRPPTARPGVSKPP